MVKTEDFTLAQKLCDVMGWLAPEENNSEFAAQTLTARNVDLLTLPNETTLNAVYQAGDAGDILGYAKNINLESAAAVETQLLKVAKKTILDPVFFDKKKQKLYPPLFNFFLYCNNLQKKGNTTEAIAAVASLAWYSTIAPRKRDKKLRDFFGIKADFDVFCEAAEKLKEIYGFSNKDIDALRYFCCQAKFDYLNKNKFDSSLNKTLYLWSEEKGTGKSTFSKILASVLNADDFKNGDIYISEYGREMGFKEHVPPKACEFNVVRLEEAMPQETKKTYGTVKTRLTTNSISFNPKHKMPVELEAKRNYICTSNDSLSKFIQDKTERRFCEIHFKKFTKKMEIQELMEIVKIFAINAEATLKFADWYWQFDLIEGVGMAAQREAEADIIKLKTVIIENYTGSVTARQIASLIYKNEPNAEQKEAVSNAMNALFPDARYESNPRCFSIAKISRYNIVEKNGLFTPQNYDKYQEPE